MQKLPNIAKYMEQRSSAISELLRESKHDLAAAIGCSVEQVVMIVDGEQIPDQYDVMGLVTFKLAPPKSTARKIGFHA
jgi:hypothetical protein